MAPLTGFTSEDALYNSVDHNYVDSLLSFCGRFSFDPRSRVTFWTQVLGQGIVYLGLLISNQMMVQRYMGVSSALKAQL